MNTLKRVWWTDHSTPRNGICTISLESADATAEHRRLRAEERAFPANPTPEHPLRHVVVLSLLGVDDVRMLRDTCNQILGE
ncbi:hypothetical protein [Burkholderia sp. Bp8990]|uniref:hypothetical protein n=1 Tax=Burkholderia sp. Bp8990 TaxID=2184552 RepID=UPI000F5B57E5|nr:hypothetical protein [Burkholderia sp. Bp8990]RQS39747.1 hypothetical protein DIE01_16165 [Burkholderia sp. Bp8990]